MEELGSGLSYAALSKIESGKRRVTLNETFELAAALRINPDALFVPLEKNASVKVGRHKVNEEVMREWIAPGGAFAMGPWQATPPFRLVRSERDEEARDYLFKERTQAVQEESSQGSEVQEAKQKSRQKKGKK